MNFTKDSLFLMEFLDSIKSKNHIFDEHINNLYIHVVGIYKELDETKLGISIQDSNITQSQNIISFLGTNSELVPKISKLENCKTLVLNNGQAFITLHYNHLSNRSIINIVKRCIILSIIHNIKNIINISIFMVNLKKKMNNKSKVLGKTEINSGVTTMSLLNNNDRNICIFRNEEYKKLIIHEIIHYLNLDFKNENYIDFSKHFNISSNCELKLYESYTEICANIINCMLSSYELNNKKNHRLFKKFLNYEIKFSLFQLAKILIFYKFDNIHDFVRPYDGNNRFRQSTPVFSYFFVKCALLYNMSSFSKFLKENCRIFEFNANLDVYNELILKCCKNDDFLNEIQKYMDFIKNNKIPLFIKKTLRMTCVELL